MPAPRGPYRPVPVRTARRAGAPLAAVIVAAIGVALVAYLALAGATNLGTFLTAVLFSTIGAVIVIAAYMWLDRWEPEPPAYLIWAFLWGGGVATVGSLVLQEVVAFGLGGRSDLLASVVGAPLFEEGLKGMFLLVMLTGPRRREMTSLTDTLVYAGMTGIGFAFMENLLYFGTSESLGQTTFMFLARILMGAFAHPFFTTMTALGVWASMRQHYTGAKAFFILLGFLGAMVLHGLWNLSASFGVGAYFGTYVAVMVPAFIVLVRQAVRSRRVEGLVVQQELPEMVWTGLVSPQEAGWLSSLHSRAARARGLPKHEKAVINHYIDAVTELAFIRNKIKRGWSTPELQAQQAELAMVVASLHTDAAPVMRPMASHAQYVQAAPPPPQAPMPYNFHQQGGNQPQPPPQPPSTPHQHPAQQRWHQPPPPPGPWH